MTDIFTQTVVRYSPKGAALQLFKNKSAEIVISGPAGTGKSMAALYKLHLAVLKTPGTKGLIVRKTATSLTATTLRTFEEKVAGECIKAGIISWFGGNAREPACYRYPGGSSIVVCGLDKPERVMSSEYDIIFADEATELAERDWELLGTRLRNNKLSWQQQIAACNPDKPTHWIQKRKERGSLVFLESRHKDNPLIYGPKGRLTKFGKEYMAKLNELTGVRKLRLKDGLWVAADGLVYEDYDPAIHVIDRFEPPSPWVRYWSIDFGFTNPFTCQFWAEDPDGRLFLYREIYKSKRLVEDHAQDILKLVTNEDNQWLEPKPSAIICDHDAEDRATLEKHLGLRTIAAKKTISDGIQAVASRFKVLEDGKARLYIMKNVLVERDQSLEELGKPACLEEEIVGYIWSNKRVTEATIKEIKEAPVKENDHGCDGMRYMVAHKDLIKKVPVGSFRIPGSSV